MLSELRRKNESVLSDERILGDNDFVKYSLKQAKVEQSEDITFMRSKCDMETLINYVCKYFELEKSQVLSRSRMSNTKQARAIICFFASQELALSGSEIGRRLNLSRSAVSRLINTFEADSKYDNLIKTLSSKC